MSVYSAAIAPSSTDDSPGALRVSAASRDHRGGRTAKSRLPARPSQSGGPHDLSPQERTQVRRLRTRLNSDDCYGYIFIFVMLLHLALIISLNIDCAQKEQRHIQPPSYMEPQHASTTCRRNVPPHGLNLSRHGRKPVPPVEPRPVEVVRAVDVPTSAAEVPAQIRPPRTRGWQASIPQLCSKALQNS